MKLRITPTLGSLLITFSIITIELVYELAKQIPKYGGYFNGFCTFFLVWFAVFVLRSIRDKV